VRPHEGASAARRSNDRTASRSRPLVEPVTASTGVTRKDDGIRPPMNRLVLRGVSWKLTGQFGQQVLRVGFALILARLLTPADFGLAAMAMVIAGLVIAFSDLGLGAALIQRTTITERDRSTVFWTGLAFGAVLTVGGILLSGPISSFYGEPAVQGLMAVLSLSFVISALGATQRSLLLREMDFRRIELSFIASLVVGGIVSVFGALAGWGAWALVAQQLVTVSGVAALLWLLCTWRPKLTFSRASARSLGGYGVDVLGTRLAYRTQESALPLIVGHALGPTPLGIFTIAYTVILVPLTRLAIPIGEVLLPAFSRIQHDREQMSGYWVRAITVLAGICAPAMLGLVIVAPEFVAVVLGNQWSEAVPVIQILAWVGLLQALGAWNSTVLMGLGQTRTMLRVTLLLLVLYVTSFVVGVQWGLIGVSITYAIAETVLGGFYFWVVTRALGIPFTTPLRALGGVVQATLLMGVAIAALELALDATQLAPVVQLAAVVALGVLLYPLALAWRAPAVAGELRTLRRRRRERMEAAALAQESRS
jgi:O-antigen/teichoic acid export membrane protein